MASVVSFKKLLSDERLLERFLAGDDDAFRVLFDRHAPRLLGYVRRMIGDEARSEDLVQETFLRIVRAAHRYEERGRFTAWIFTIATRLCYNEIGRRRRTPMEEGIGEGPPSLTEGPGREETILDRIDVERMEDELQGALARLSEGHRAVFVLRYYERLSYAAVARVLGISEGTAKSRMHFAVRRLRSLLRAERARGPVRRDSIRNVRGGDIEIRSRTVDSGERRAGS
jgi:RNA polymerase sigma-70 factor (ECF subfamily)